MSHNTSIWHKLARNTASNFAGALIPMAIGFFLLPFIIYHIGVADYGIWLLANVVIGYMGLINLGLGPTVTKKSAEHLADGNIGNLNRMLSTVLVIYLILGTILGFVILAAGPFIPHWFDAEPQQINQLKWVIWLVGIQAVVGFPFAIFSGLVKGLQDFHILNSIIILNVVLRLVGTVILLNKGFGLISLILLEFLLSTISWALQISWVRHRIPGMRLRLLLFDHKQIVPLFRFGGAMLAWQVTSMTIRRSSRIIVGLFLPIANITVYEVGNRTIEYSRSLFNSFLAPLLPASSELNARNLDANLRGIYLRSTKLVFALYTAITVALLFWAKAFIFLWVGESFIASVTIIHILLIGNLYQTQNVVAWVILPGMGKLKAFTWIAVAYPLILISSGVILIQQYGLIGVAVSTSASFIVLETCFIYQVLKIFNIPVNEFIKHCHLPSIFSIGPALLFAIIISSVISIDTWFKLTLIVTCYFAIWCTTFWFLGLNEQERVRIKRLFRSYTARGTTIDSKYN